MRVPIAESGASIRKLGVSTATADDFGAGIGRAQVQTGRAIRQNASTMSDIAINIEHKRVSRERIEVYNAASEVANKELQQKVFSLRGAQTDVLAGDGFDSIVGGIQTKAFSEAVKGRDSKVTQAATRMWERRRIALQDRVVTHYSTEQDRAYREATEHGYKQTVGFAAEGLAAGKPPEADDFADAISATRAYINARGLRRTEEEIARSARSAVHGSAIEGMMMAAEFDRADAYLDTLTKKGSPYKKDFDRKQVDATRSSIEQGRTRHEAQQRRAHLTSSTEALTQFQLDHGSNPTEAQGRAMGLPDSMLLDLRKSDTTTTAYADVSELMNGYNRNTSENREEIGAQVTTLLGALPAGMKAPLSKLWKLKTTPGKEVQALGLERVQTFIEKGDFKRGPGDGWSEKDQAEQVALETDMFQRWVKESNPSDDDILNYTQTNPRYKALRSSLNLEVFKRSLNTPKVKALPTLGGAQGVYFSEGEVSIFEGL